MTTRPQLPHPPALPALAALLALAIAIALPAPSSRAAAWTR